ncbi:MAG TPA: hypothetical protein VMW87_01730 [Spirochaetia bacterium]|nr:hypothetical protein [Spirochaetia bacterium]
MNELVPREVLAKQGMKAVGGIGGGAALLILSAVTASHLPAIIIGGILTIVGLAITSKAKDDRIAGTVAVGAGVLALLKGIGIFAKLAGGLIWVSGVGLIIAGGISLYKFIKGLKSRG